MTERQISDGLCAYLRKEGLSFIRARTDKKSGIQEGWPDVTVVHCSRVWLCELKTPTGRLSQKQVECHAKLKKNGTPVTVARSVEESVNAVRAFFGILTPGEQQNELQGATERQEGLSKTDLSGSNALKPRHGVGLEDAKARPSGTAKGQSLSSSVAQKLYIADWKGTPWVCGEKLVGPDHLIRRATPQDIRDLPRR